VGPGAVRLEPLALLGLLLLAAGFAEPDQDGRTASPAATDGHGTAALAPASAPTPAAAGTATTGPASSTPAAAPTSAGAIAA
jgi:hypothetical protein